MKFKTTFYALFLATGMMTITACSGAGVTLSGRSDYAQSLADKSHMVRRDIPANGFVLASWQKITQPGAPIHLYIEGDGSSWISRSTPAANPTPKEPLALELAALDPSPNVVYVARPCQFTEIGVPGNICDQSYWMSKRFAPEVIQSFDEALDAIAAEQKPQGFDLIGFSGGANVAGLLAERRNDILSLRTVAGNVDNDFFTILHKVSSMPLSLNMADEAPKLATLPQRHFIGGKDRFVPESIYESYKRAAGSPACLQSTIMPEATHLESWTQNWPHLLNEPLSCP